MIATVSHTPHLQYNGSRMSNDPDQAYRYGYAPDYSRQPEPRIRSPQRAGALNAVPQYSLDFLDVSAHQRSSAIRPAAENGPTIQHNTASGPATFQSDTWVSDEQGHVRTGSDLNMDYDEVEEDDQEDNMRDSPGPAMTSAEAAMAKRKMKRFRLTHNQTRFLMDEFLKQPHPDAAHRDYLSKLIPGLSPRQVQIWFQNRRAKLKRLSADDRERLDQQRRAILDDETRDARRSADAMQYRDDNTLSRTTSRSEKAPQPSTASLFAKAHERAGMDVTQSASPNPVHSTSAKLAASDNLGRRRTRGVRREPALLFGWDVSVYVDDSGSELADDGSSVVSSEDVGDGEEEIERDGGQRYHVPIMQVGIPDDRGDTWPTHQQAQARRASIQANTDTIDAPSTQRRPVYVSRPTWPAPHASYSNQYGPGGAPGHGAHR